MPIVVERALEHEADKKGFKGEHKARYIYGTMNKLGFMKGNKETKKGKNADKKRILARKMSPKTQITNYNKFLSKR